MENRIYEIWEYSKKNKKLYKWLNEDNLGAFIVDGKVFWYELNPCSTMPNYIYSILIKYGKRQGLTYLYDLPIPSKV